MWQKYYKQKQTANADSTNNLMRQWQHIISECSILAKELYVKRHDRVCAELHCNICKETGLELDNEHWYDHGEKSVTTSLEG